MRLRNIPGADDAILNSEYCIKNPEEQKGHWQDCFDKVQPLHIEIGMGKGRFIMDTAAENHTDEGHAGRVNECRRQAEEDRHQRGSYPDGEARAETEARAVGDHRDRQNKDERPLKHGAGLAVDQEQDRKERGDHRTERDFLSFLVQYVYLGSKF